MLDIKLYIQENYIKKQKYINMIENLKTKINIEYFKVSFLNNINIDKKTFIICNKNYKIKGSHDNFISALKSILNVKKCTIYRTDILINLCKNIPIIIISSGPSSNIDFVELKEIENHYIIMAIKYVRNILLYYDIQIDFTITSFCKKNFFDNKNPNECKTISLHVVNDELIDYDKDILFRPITINNFHTINFNKAILEKNIDIFNIIPLKIKSKYCLFNYAHIMLEVAIPISVFIGCNNIYTFQIL